MYFEYKDVYLAAHRVIGLPTLREMVGWDPCNPIDFTPQTSHTCPAILGELREDGFVVPK